MVTILFPREGGLPQDAKSPEGRAGEVVASSGRRSGAPSCGGEEVI